MCRKSEYRGSSILISKRHDEGSCNHGHLSSEVEEVRNLCGLGEAIFKIDPRSFIIEESDGTWLT